MENAAGSHISERETWRWVNKLKGLKKCAMPRREWFEERLFLSSFVLFVFHSFPNFNRVDGDEIYEE